MSPHEDIVRLARGRVPRVRTQILDWTNHVIVPHPERAPLSLRDKHEGGGRSRASTHEEAKNEGAEQGAYETLDSLLWRQGK